MWLIYKSLWSILFRIKDVLCGNLTGDRSKGLKIMCILVFLFIFTSISYGNISFMGHRLLHDNKNFVQIRNVAYTYDQLNRLIKTDDFEQGYFDESFAYDALGRIVAQRRDTSIAKNAGGEYAYHANTNRLKSIANGMGGTADDRNMSYANNFVYDSEGNLIEDKSKKMRITYDWRGMPVEFVRRAGNVYSLKLVMAYDGSGKRISKTSMRKMSGGEWDSLKVTHYTGIGTEIRENFAGPTKETKVVVNMPQGLGRYGIEDAERPDFDGMTGNSQVGYIPNVKFEWYLKNHLGSTMLVYGTVAFTNPNTADIGETKAAYDYRAFGEMVTLSQPSDKVTENFTGKEHDDEIKLSYHGARYLDPMLGIWISVDPQRIFPSPYLYMGNGMNPVVLMDTSGAAPLGFGGPIGVIASVPAATYNAVMAEWKMFCNGQPYSEQLKAGMYAYFGTLAGGFLLGSKNPFMNAAWGGVSSGISNAVGQKVIDGNSEIDTDELAIEIRNGAFFGMGSVGGVKIAETQFMFPTADYLGGFLGTAATAGFLLLSHDEPTPTNERKEQDLDE
uniref:RHS repeat domain-containing protein n=1 Tax=uncultured Fibrobacter sp. TaxID=261512 RepID=UPI002638262F|nr:RHS repeat-associated core domain-containing protein [uncultured Fibrobacter sp.]